MPLLRYLLNELLDENQDGIPDQRGIPRTPGMSLGDPSSDERLDDFTGIDQPELDQFAEEDYDSSPLDQFLERFSASGMPQGLARPRGFGQGLLSGIAQGAVGRGQRVGERRKKFETAQTQRAAERDKANLQATRDLAKERAAGTRDAVRGSRAERAKQVEYERANPKPTPQQLETMPWLSRIADENGRVRRADLLSDDPSAAGQKETRRQFENDRDYNLRVRAEGRQSAKDKAEADAAGKPGSGKPPTVAQERAQLFYARAREASDGAVKNGLEGRLIKKAWSLAQPPALQGDSDTREYWRAMESFTLALNRLESGAAIAPTEFQKVRQLYFVTPGDKEADIKAKVKMRQTIVENLWRMQSQGMRDEQAAAGGTITPAQLWEP